MEYTIHGIPPTRNPKRNLDIFYKILQNSFHVNFSQNSAERNFVNQWNTGFRDSAEFEVQSIKTLQKAEFRGIEIQTKNICWNSLVRKFSPSWDR